MYHFSPADFALRCLRQGDYRGALARAAGDPTVAAAPGTLVFSAVFWRSAWKYRVRSYRYCFWDNGTIVANLLAAATAAGLPVRVLMGFVDAQVNHLLGLDGHREASTCLAPLGQPVDLLSLAETDQVPPLSAEIEPLLQGGDRLPGDCSPAHRLGPDHPGGGRGVARVPALPSQHRAPGRAILSAPSNRRWLPHGPWAMSSASVVPPAASRA